jgi:hypothetical protein
VPPPIVTGRGWSEEQWRAASERLVEQGWLEPDGKQSEHGSAAFQAVETPPQAAARLWQRSGRGPTASRSCSSPVARPAGVIPPGNRSGLPALPAR